MRRGSMWLVYFFFLDFDFDFDFFFDAGFLLPMNITFLSFLPQAVHRGALGT